MSGYARCFPTGIGMRTLLDTRFFYVTLMLRNTMENFMNLLWGLPHRKHDTYYKESTTDKNGSRFANVQRFRYLVGNMRFWDAVQTAFGMLPPSLMVTIRFIEGDNSRMSFVCPIFTSLKQELHKRGCTSLDPEGVQI